MTYDELRARLKARQALIVHFSHHAAMRGELVYPTDLRQVFAEQEAWPLSCSVLTPGHRMKVVGSVGVVLEPRTAEDVLRVYHDDAGAYAEGSNNHSLGELLSAASFDASLNRVAPGSYNEWRVRGAKPVGLFIEDPANIEVRHKAQCELPWGTETIIAPKRICLAEVRTAFPDKPIWTMDSNGPRLL
ncbi:hypothetical protein [Neoroseomonas soli]|uniref:Uncharacterized protein n=1 Tax=Neoroseomonas soli TaxID=1081025 RepID=A0A9X9WUB5_9PROT|nr:hypothetical protein [Neoroseomonas soli]MBR0670744.1 hypothetical protein [Neoroseomonas soli]